MRVPAVVSVALSLLAMASPLSAQLVVGKGRVTGIVVTASDSTTLPGATVDLAGAQRRASTTARGTFVLDSVAPGMQHITVRQLGYLAATATVDVADGQSSFVLIRLTRLPRQLSRVDIRGKRIEVPRRFQEAADRADLNNGYIVTAADIRLLNPIETKRLLERLPGVHVHDQGISFARCDAGLTFVNASMSGEGPPHAPRQNAKIQVYIDGQRVTNDVGEADAEWALRQVAPSEIGLMEVYTGVARIPAEWFADACGVIAIWTKGF